MSTDLGKAAQALVANGMRNLAADETDLTVRGVLRAVDRDMRAQRESELVVA
jgi:hypothetical protein